MPEAAGKGFEGASPPAHGDGNRPRAGGWYLMSCSQGCWDLVKQFYLSRPKQGGFLYPVPRSLQ